MRLAISNIAWNTADDEAVAALLQRYGVDAIDVAPGKYFPDPATVNDQDIQRVRQWWQERGIELTGMQSLLFGTTGLNLFGATEVQQAMLRHLTAMCRIGAGLGATRLVFGSPKNRDRSGLSDTAVQDIAVPFFRQLGNIALTYGVTICLEPNPPRYGANFMTTTDETAAVVRAVDHPAIRMQLDTGTVTINQENISDIMAQHAGLIGHIHASEPDLVTLGTGGADHGTIAPPVTYALPDHVVTIEMLSPKDQPVLPTIEAALQTAIKFYRA